MKKSELVAQALIIVTATLLFLPYLGSVHLFDWDEINFAECAREMLVTGNYTNLQMNFFPFWEKPPLFIWMQALSMQVFGVNEFAARFPNAVCGVFTFVFLFRAGCRLKGKLFGWLWVAMYAGSVLPQFYFHSGIIDPWFNFFIFTGFYYFLRYLQEGTAKLKNLGLAAVFAGLAILTKGPAALIILGVCLVVIQLRTPKKLLLPVSHMLLLLVVVTVVGGLWFIILVLKGHYALLAEFVSYQYHLFRVEDSGHGGPWFYHPLVLLIGCFPASIFAIKKLFFFRATTNAFSGYERGMRALFWVVLILFSIVQTKIIHYSSLCYFPLTFFAALQVWEWIAEDKTTKLWQKSSLLVVGSIYVVLFFALAAVGTVKETLIEASFINDQMAIENLKANVHTSVFDFLPGIFMLLAVLVIARFSGKNIQQSSLLLLASVAVSVQLAVVHLTPKVENITQKVVIDFYKNLRDKDCYAASLNYLSYAPYFYAQQLPPPNIAPRSIIDFLTDGPIDKDAYFVSKVTDVENYATRYPQLREMYRSNGFVFYMRPRKK